MYICTYKTSCFLLPSVFNKNFLPSRQGKVTHLLSCISGALTVVSEMAGKFLQVLQIKKIKGFVHVYAIILFK